MNKPDKTRLTRAKNAFDRCGKKYMSSPSPYIIGKYRQAIAKYKEVTAELQRKYKGEQIEFELN